MHDFTDTYTAYRIVKKIAYKDYVMRYKGRKNVSKYKSRVQKLLQKSVSVYKE
jgi:hypothetical protein